MSKKNNNIEEEEYDENQLCNNCNEEKEINDFLILSKKCIECRKIKKPKIKDDVDKLIDLEIEYNNVFNNNQKLLNISKKDKIMLIKFLKKKMLI